MTFNSGSTTLATDWTWLRFTSKSRPQCKYSDDAVNSTFPSWPFPFKARKRILTPEDTWTSRMKINSSAANFLSWPFPLTASAESRSLLSWLFPSWNRRKSFACGVRPAVRCWQAPPSQKAVLRIAASAERRRSTASLSALFSWQLARSTSTEKPSQGLHGKFLGFIPTAASSDAAFAERRWSTGFDSSLGFQWIPRTRKGS